MDENQYQLGIRKLSPHEMVTLITVYRNKLKECSTLCKAFAQENFAQDVMHKIVCGYKKAELDILIEDYECAIREGKS